MVVHVNSSGLNMTVNDVPFMGIFEYCGTTYLRIKNNPNFTVKSSSGLTEPVHLVVNLSNKCLGAFSLNASVTKFHGTLELD